MKFVTQMFNISHHTLPVLLQKFFKSIKIWQNYREFKSANFFETQCIMCNIVLYKEY